MVKRIVPIRFISFCLLVACEALCQSELPSADLRQRDRSNSPEAPRQEMRTWRSLPDAPSTVQPPKQADEFPTFAADVRTPLTPGVADINSAAGRAGLGNIPPGPQPVFSISRKTAVTQEDNFVAKYLYSPLLKQNLLYHPSTSDSFMGRATYSASRIFITQDDYGKRKLNTSYFLGVLGSVAMHRAYRPYYVRSPSATFNDFGSTIGNDAGMNLFHEFGPGIRQIVKGHTPKFALKIGERITHDQKRREAVSSSSR
jgi:hypothetical protein